MAKPSKTNIQPPTTPPKTNWDLDLQADRDAAIAAGTYGDNDGIPNNAFDTLIHQINIPTTGPDLAVDDLQEYDYAFFGVNGGSDETVYGRDELAGILVTGNGKDHVYGGQWDDVIFSGNGADVDHGGGGNDIIYSENGPDQLYGDADEGTANFVDGGDGGNGFGDAFVWDHDPTDDNNTDATELPSSAQTFQAKQEGFYDDGTTVWRVFSFDNLLSTDQTVSFEQSDQISGDTGVVSGSFTAYAGHTTYFLVADSSLTDQGRIDISYSDGIESEHPPNLAIDTFSRNHIALDTNDPSGGQGVFEFTAGDQLIGGNGPDQFIWDANDGPQNVDLIWDYNQGSGTYDPTEGDQLILQNTGLTDVSQLTTTLDHDLDGDGNNDLVIFFSEDHAIGLVGIDDISKVDVHFG